MKTQTIKAQGQAHNRRHFLKLLLLVSTGAFARKLLGKDAEQTNTTGESGFDLKKAVLIPFPPDHPQNKEYELKGRYRGVPEGGLVELWMRGVPLSETTNYVLPSYSFPLNTSEPTIFVDTVLSHIAGDSITITLYYNTSSNHFDEPVLFAVALLDKEKNILSLQRRRAGPLRPRRPDERRMIISFVPKTYDPVRVDFNSIDIEKTAYVAIAAE